MLATGNGGHAKGFFRAYACAAGTPGLCTTVFCSYLEAQYFVVLLVKLYSSLSSCLSDSASRALGSDFAPWDISEFLSSFNHGQNKSQPLSLFSFPPEFLYKKHPKEPEFSM